VSTSSRIGIIIMAVLSLGNVPSVLTTDGEHPPLAIAAVLTAVGVAGVVFSVFAWRGNRPSLIALVSVQAVSALSAVPAFTEDGVPTALRLIAAVVLAVTVIGIALVAPALRRRPAAHSV